MKYNRNDTCHCGSGLKYKKCCMNVNSQINEEIQPTIKTILVWLKSGLENYDKLLESRKKILVKGLTILNENTIECKFYSYSENSIDVKGEIATIIGFMHGFLKEDSFENLKINYYAARAYDKNDIEILNALSYKDTAKQIGQGNSIDWLKSTLFTENTNDYRLGIAKRIISEIEISLRYAIESILFEKYGSDWWNIALNNKIGESIKTTYYEQFGEKIFDGKILINYTYILQLKKITLTHWIEFKHLFRSRENFETIIDRLNILRREEAHNRNITENNLKELEEIYNILLEKISVKYENLIPKYLIDNWRLRIKSIMNNKLQPIFKPEEISGEKDLNKKLNKISLSAVNLINYLDDTIKKLESVIVPVQKKIIHEELIHQYLILKNLQNTKLEQIRNKNFKNTESTIKAIEKHEKDMKIFSGKFLLFES
ncbi:SEC-C domain-containing protein [Flavobacterium sp. W20_MBD1_R3]|uniref:SEC-C domain-containing protein n=1 Tax=Flavobacterium sp. W20_MBD1_R3 TaxID=3240278 RepID=UPI003F9363CA